MPHVAFLHERFLFRFGHDRVMLLHGRELVRRGWRVSFVAFAADRAVIEGIGARAVILPNAAVDYGELDAFGCPHLRDRWFDLFAEDPPDVAVIGGWPFYAFHAMAEALGVAAVTFDGGVTPLEGLPEADLPVHMKLRRLRREHLPHARRSVAFSRFLADSQTRADAPEVVNHVVLNGVDHVVEPLWGESGAEEARATLAVARAGGRKVVLHLGRWEGAYKNKAGALDMLRALRARHDAAMLVLAKEDAEAPEDLRPHLVFAGHPSDGGLRELMLGADAGFSASLWEGFNLPLAEMNWLGRPAFALDLAAHPEVVPAPAFVRPSLEALAEALSGTLAGEAPSVSAEALAVYRERLSWRRVAGELEAVLHAALDEKRRETTPLLLAMDVTNAARDPANTGVVRVTRQLARALQPLHPLLFLTWDEGFGGYRTLDDRERQRLGSYGGPRVPALEVEPPRPLGEALTVRRMGHTHLAWLDAETVLQPRGAAVADWYAGERIAFVAVLHDLIPLTHPQFCAAPIVEAFPAYARFLAQARTLIANSQTTAAAWREHGGQGPELVIETLAGDFGPRGTPKPPNAADPLRILTVSTFEPRKNHATLLAAFRLAKAQVGGRRLELHLVGNAYADGGGALAAVLEAARADPAVVVHGVVDDATLADLHARADFTVYPSLWEGYGLPLAESVHRARPFVCSGEGSMGEIAACGAGLTCEVTDPRALADAMVRLATDDALRARLSRIAALTPTRRWDDYARAALSHALAGRPAAPGLAPRSPPRRPRTAPSAGAAMDAAPADANDWNGVLYPGNPTTDWQMTDSERMALTGLLARRRPKTYLEIGAYKGGSARLASEFSDWVISLDIDPAAGERLEGLTNVTFMAGRSQEVLPDLLQDLLARDLYPEFVLIDGDHSAEGVRRDMEIVLSVRPPRPMLVVFHDSFNPECRRGILAAPWGDCPYVAGLELDFVPGRLVDVQGDPARGEMWGGLAVALLSPEPQPHPHMTHVGELAYRRTLAQSAHAAPVPA